MASAWRLVRQLAMGVAVKADEAFEGALGRRRLCCSMWVSGVTTTFEATALVVHASEMTVEVMAAAAYVRKTSVLLDFILNEWMVD